MKRPLVIPIIFFLIGILASNATRIPPAAGHVPVIVLVLVLMLFLLVAASRNRRFFYVLLCLFFFLLGFFRHAGSMIPGENDISKFVGKDPREALVSGTVTADPEWRGSSYARRLVFHLKAKRFLVDGNEHSASGVVCVNLFKPREQPQIGDELIIGGRISLPPGKKNPAGFDYRTYLDRMGIRAMMFSSGKDHYLKTGVKKGLFIRVRRLLSAARDGAGSIVHRYLSGVPKTITESVILGLRSGVAPETNDVFIKTGTMHILAVSGLHVGIVAVAIMGLLRLMRCPGNLAYFVTVLGICAFAVFTGSRPSSIRAALMGSFILFSMSLGRKADITNALALSAFLITFFQPGQLFRPGFILSYLAVLSIIYVTPLTDAFFGVGVRRFRENVLTAAKRYLLKSLSVSFAVWIGMMPVIAFYFRIITPSVILSNLIAVPALFLMVVLGFSLLLTGSLGLLKPLAVLISGVLDVVIPFFIDIMCAISRIPFSFIKVSSSGWILIVAFYAALTGTIMLFHQNRKHRVLIIIFLILAADLFIWNEISHEPPDSLRATFFDTGKADASLLEFPDGSVMLVDGASGGKDTGMDDGRNILSPYLRQRGIRRIDCALLTHAHEDHIGGLLYVLRNFSIGTVIDGGNFMEKGPERALYAEFRKIVTDKNINYLKVKRGDIVKGLPGMDIVVLNPPGNRSYGDLNNDSVVIKTVTEKNKSVLFCADAEAKAMKDMLCFGSLLKADLIKVPHHGAGLGNMFIVKEFLGRAGPASAVITNKSAGCVNKDLMEIFRENGTTVYITGESGALIAEEADHGFTVWRCCGGK
jgi:competence protein ComEC